MMEIVHRLPHDPVHLYQLNKASGAYYNEKGCGAFTTAMALSYYNPARFGVYRAAQEIFGRMLKVPFFGGTFERQNAAIGRRHNLIASAYSRGTVTDLAAAIDSGAPTIMLINPGLFGIGQHDVLLVGYSVDSNGNFVNLFVNNPAIERATLDAPPGLAYPGNEIIPVSTLPQKWTGCFTPFFASTSTFTEWRVATSRAAPSMA